MKPKLIIAILLLAFSLTTSAQKKLSFDGYYRTLPDTLNPFTFYLRFYPDSAVIGTSTAGNPKNLVPWFKKERKNVSKGKYTLVDSTITFLLIAEEGTVQYDGKLLAKDRLWLHVKSLINKYEAKEEYFFMKMEGVK